MNTTSKKGQERLCLSWWMSTGISFVFHSSSHPRDSGDAVWLLKPFVGMNLCGLLPMTLMDITNDMAVPPNNSWMTTQQPTRLRLRLCRFFSRRSLCLWRYCTRKAKASMAPTKAGAYLSKNQHQSDVPSDLAIIGRSANARNF